MTLMLTGKTAHTRRAKSLGIADQVVRKASPPQAAADGIQRNTNRAGKARRV
jgi:enoyl-CoA hydratase/carnithine racemase